MAETKVEGFNLQAGMLVQTVFNSVTASPTTATTSIPFDNSIPQITEGSEVLTCSITPKFSTSKLLIQVIMFVGEETNAQNMITVALFRDSTADALAVSFVASDFANFNVGANFSFAPVILNTYIDATSTSATTFRIRAGGNATGAIRVNGVNGTQQFNGALISSITIQEIKQ